MLTHSLFVLIQGELSSSDRNAWIEVFAIHSRNLNEFFARKDSGGAYMRPDHFVQWLYDYSFDSGLARRASSQVAHLTYDREVPGKKTPWVIDEYFFPLRNQAVRFLQEILSVPELMSFQRNRERTMSLLDFLPRIRIEETNQAV